MGGFGYDLGNTHNKSSYIKYSIYNNVTLMYLGISWVWRVMDIYN